MMDLKEIIKWFIPCFHILLLKKYKMNIRLTFLFLFLFFNLCSGMEVAANSDSDIVSEYQKLNLRNVGRAKNVANKQSEILLSVRENESVRSIADINIGRTFGRPFKKMAAALIPLVFQMGMAATWAVVAALVGIKTLAVSLIILKVLLVAGAAKVGALFAHKGHHAPSHGWEPQKEIHLHIHNGQHGLHDEHPITSWSREGSEKEISVALNPYMAGPQTISTPYGHYVKINPSTTNVK